EANCRVGARQAQTFMRLARNRHKLEALTKTRSDSYLTIAAAEALVGCPRPERPRGLPGQLDMLGGEEVIARPPALRGRALFDLIVDLEQALAIINHWNVRRKGDLAPRRKGQADQRRKNGLRVIASIIRATIAHLKARQRRQRRPPR